MGWTTARTATSRPSYPVNGTRSMPCRMDLDSWRYDMVKKIVEFVADVVGLIVAVIGITIFGIAFS